MDTVLHAAGLALGVLFTPLRMAMLLGGVFLGLLAGIIPGLGGIAALSLLLPFTFGMDPYSAMAILMGLTAAISHGDVIPAVLFGVPGTVGCAATVVDGYPMAKRGEAGRALGAAFSASLLGGVAGAVILGVTIPVISRFILFFQAPQLLAICIFGMTLVASLSGNAPLKGLVAGTIGLLLSMIGEAPQTGTLRFTFDTLYLWTGMPIVPVALGIFAVPELCDMMINRASIAVSGPIDARRGQWQGWRDTFVNWFLVVRTGALGAVCGMVPGLGAAVIDWIAYGHALKTERGAAQSFGKGDVRGVIAAESSTNARDGGSLVTTIAFGMPGQASMAILLSAFLIQGITPGPSMLTHHLDLTYTIVWSLTLANVFGTAICFALANQFARIATVRYSVLLPIVTTLVFLGAFQAQHSWGDIVALVFLGSFGWLMKRCGWPRPPLVLGFVLGKLIERYTFISVERYGWDWLTNWFVILMVVLSAFSVARRLMSNLRLSDIHSFIGRRLAVMRPQFTLQFVLAGGVLAGFLGSFIFETPWPFAARLVPQIVSAFGTAFALMLFLRETFFGMSATEGVSATEIRGSSTAMDLHGSYGELSDHEIYARAAGYFLWIGSVLVVGYLIGLVPALVLSALGFMRFVGRERWLPTLAVSTTMALFIWVVFNQLVHDPWPPTVIGALFPNLRETLPWL